MWPYFKSLRFLLGTVKPRTSSSNLRSSSEHQDGNIELMSPNDNDDRELTESVEEMENEVSDIQHGSEKTKMDYSTQTNCLSSEKFPQKR